MSWRTSPSNACAPARCGSSSPRRNYAANIRLEINDNVVQGVAVAKYALDLGKTEKVQEAIEGTLAAARAIISDLLEEIGDDDIFGPTTLVRDRAATGFTRKEL